MVSVLSKSSKFLYNTRIIAIPTFHMNYILRNAAYQKRAVLILKDVQDLIVNLNILYKKTRIISIETIPVIYSFQCDD